MKIFNRLVKSVITVFFMIAATYLPLYGANFNPSGLQYELRNGDFSQGKDYWKLTTHDEKDSVWAIEDNSLKLQRTKKGYFLRAYQDILVKPGTRYLFKFQIKTDGPGYGSARFHFRGEDGIWEKVTIYSKWLKEAEDWEEVTTVIPVPQDIIVLRISLGIIGENTTVWFRDVSFEEVLSGRAVTVPATEAKVVLDGKLDDPLWEDAVELADFRVLGDPNEKAELETKVLLVMKDDFLYIGFHLEEPQIDEMKIQIREDCLTIHRDDCVEIFISPNITPVRPPYNQIIVNALGYRYFLQKDYAKLDRYWHPTIADLLSADDWEAKTYIGKKSWSVEIKLNINDIFAGAGIDGIKDNPRIWVNFARHRPHGDQKHVNWAGLSGKRLHVPKEFQPITLTWNNREAGEEVGERTKSSFFTKRLETPDILIAGKPIKLIKYEGGLPFSSEINIIENNILIGAELENLIKNSIRGDQNTGIINVIIERLSKFNDVLEELSQEEKALMESDEAFVLDIRENTVTINAGTRYGILRGISTLVLLATRARFSPEQAIPFCRIFDAPRLKFRGWQIDGKKPMENLKQQVDIAFLLRLNHMFLSITTEYSPFPFESWPNIGDMSRTKEEWIDLFSYARARGVELIPIFRSWGRAGGIPSKPEYKHLAVRPDLPYGTRHKRPHDKNLCAANPETFKLIFDLQKELIETLNLQGLHIGHDELHFDDMVTSPLARKRNWQRSDYIIETVTKNNQFLREQGVTMYIWGDMLDPDQNGRFLDISGPELLAKLPKDVVIMDWKYEGKFDRAEHFPSIQMFVDAGFQTIGSPWWDPINVAGIIRDVYAANAYGVVMTSWSNTNPDRMLPEMIRALSLGSYLSWSPENTNLTQFPYLPDIIFKTAAYHIHSEKGLADNVRHIVLKDHLTQGQELARKMGFPENVDFNFLNTRVANYRGVDFKIFSKDGKPAGLVVPGEHRAEVFNEDFSRGFASWRQDSHKKGDSTFLVNDEVMFIKRKTDDYHLRLFQDIPVQPNTQYVLTYKIKVEGSGFGQAWIFLGDGRRNWSKPIRGSRVKKGDWSEQQIAFVTNKNTRQIRINLGVQGIETAGWFDDIVVLSEDKKIEKRKENIKVEINNRANYLTFLHTLNKQPIGDLRMHDINKRFSTLIPGEYKIHYEDGSTHRITLRFREDIVGWNDRSMGRNTNYGFFGTINNSYHINIPSYTYKNPYPDKKIKEIEIIPGNSSDLNLIVFAISLD